MIAELPTSDLLEVAEKYRFWREKDSNYAPDALARKQLMAIEARTHKLIAALNQANPRARTALRIDAPAYSEISSTMSALAESARIAREGLPRSSLDSASRMAASRLRELFAHHGLPFSATASDEHGNTSTAVSAFRNAAHLAGDTRVTAASARKWIEFAITERNEKARETVNEKSAGRFPIR